MTGKRNGHNSIAYANLFTLIETEVLICDFFYEKTQITFRVSSLLIFRQLNKVFAIFLVTIDQFSISTIIIMVIIGTVQCTSRASADEIIRQFVFIKMIQDHRF